jgi:hypothetical protein
MHDDNEPFIIQLLTGLCNKVDLNLYARGTKEVWTPHSFDLAFVINILAFFHGVLPYLD